MKAALALVSVAAAALAVLVLLLPGHGSRPRNPPPRAAITLPADAKAFEWASYGFDSARTHEAPFGPAPPFRVRWKQVGDWSLIEFPPIVVGGRLYFGTNRGSVFSLDAATGSVVWRRILGRCTAASPAVAGDLLLIGVMGPRHHCDDDGPAYLAALDLRDGHTRWRYRTGDVETPPLVVGKLVVFGSWDGRINAVDTRGRLRWSVQTNGAVKAGAALWHSAIYIGSYDGFLYALDARTGRLRWRAAAGGRFYATPSIAEGRVIAATTDGLVHAFEARSGEPLWSRRIGPFAYAAAAVAGGRAYVGSYDHRLYALDARTGRILWTAAGPGPVSGAPTVVGGLVYFSTCGSCSSHESNARARQTFAVDAATGALRWRFPDGEYSPIVTDGLRLYLTGYTALYALEPAR
jgi:outer membrane protein assembly factor BamB